MSKINEVKSLPGNVFEWTVRLARDTGYPVGLDGYEWKSGPFRVPCNPCNDNGYHLWVMKLYRKYEKSPLNYYMVKSLSELFDNSTDSPSVSESRFRGKMMKLKLHSKFYFHNINEQPHVIDNISKEMTTANNFSASLKNVSSSLDKEIFAYTQRMQIMFIMTCEVRFHRGTH